MKKNLIALFLLAGLIASSCTFNSIFKDKNKEVKNIIFFIGDGMGVAHVNAAIMRSGEKINMAKCPVSGFATTYSLTSKITDSAAAGTALATGNKTTNGIIAQDTLGNDYKSILKIVEEQGLSTGLVSTSAFTHATPASFFANNPSRSNYEAIAADFLKTDIDVLIGGGYVHLANRKDSVNYIDSLRNRNYQVALDMEEMRAVKDGKLAALLYDVHSPKYSEGRGEMLPESTAKALEILSMNKKGFFLMVEGSQIDWGGHDNDAEYVTSETLDFDRAIGVALEFQKTHPNTLIVVTADHETGGITFPSPKGNYSQDTVVFSTKGHTGIMVPVFASGPGAEEFSGIFDNTEFFIKFLKLYSFPL